MIPLYKPDISEADIQAISDTLRSGNLTTGTVVQEFEEEFATFVGIKHAIAVDSLTNGYLLVLDLLTPHSLVMPSATYISMANIPKKMGMKIQFKDEWIAGRDYVIQTDKGDIVDSAHLLEKDICKKNPDAIWLFSLHATKLITSGTGGMICTNSDDFANHLKVMRNSGRLKTSRGFDYVVTEAGWNFYMSDIQAALGLSQLRRYDELMKLRDECYETYQKYLKPNKYDRRTKYIYQIWVENIYGFADYMRDKGIAVSKHFTPIHTQPAFSTNQSLRDSEVLSEHLASIPYYPRLPEKDIEIVSKAINEWRTR